MSDSPCIAVVKILALHTFAALLSLKGNINIIDKDTHLFAIYSSMHFCVQVPLGAYFQWKADDPDAISSTRRSYEFRSITLGISLYSYMPLEKAFNFHHCTLMPLIHLSRLPATPFIVYFSIF